MKVLCIYFSATGGTKTFQQVIQKTCNNYDIQFTSVDLTDDTFCINEKWLSQFDSYIIGAPIIFRSLPSTFTTTIKSAFLNSKGKKVILYTTSRSGVHSATYGLKRTLSSRGYNVVGVLNIKSINNFYFSNSIGHKQKTSLDKTIEEFELQARIAKELLLTDTAEYNTIANKSYVYFYSTLYYNIKKIIYINKFAYRNFSTNFDSCKGCGICAKNCPNENIVMYNDHPVFKNTCYACTKCIQNCPKNAILYKNQHIEQMTHISIDDFENH